MGQITYFTYLLSAIFFILSLKDLSSQITARRGIFLGIIGMMVAIVTTFMLPIIESFKFSVIAMVLGAIVGITIAIRIQMTALPQLVAAFHSLVGLAAVIVALAAFLAPEVYGISGIDVIPFGNRIEMSIGIAIGAITFTGSLIAFAKLQGIMGSKPLRFKFINLLNFALLSLAIFLVVLFCRSPTLTLFIMLSLLSALIGIMLILPIGGADMPVVVSMLNSYSGWAAAGIGFTLSNSLLIITGALVGSSGAILSYIMCKAMNRNILKVIFGAFGASTQTTEENYDKTYKTGSPEDAAFMMVNSSSVILVPGYGMAVSGAQHALKVVSDLLKQVGIKVKFAIHPVAGRMPGHMNVLLAEANIDYEDVFELESINTDFKNTDVVLVVGANDITNPAAKNDPTSPIYGMPILDCSSAKTVFFVKRSMASGYAGIENQLFYKDNTYMLFGDAKKVLEEIIKDLEKMAKNY